MLRHKRDRHGHHVAHTGGPQLTDRVVCVRPKPLDGTNAALVRERVVVHVPEPAQLRHHRAHRGLRLLLIRVAERLNILLREPMRGEEDGRLRAIGVRVALFADEPRECRHVPGASVPRGDHHGAHLSQLLVSVEHALEKSERRARGGDGELRVEGQHYEAAHAVRLDRLERLLRERVPVPHRHVRLRLDASPCERCLERTPLLERRRELRRAAADGSVSLAALRRARARDDERERAVEPREERGQRDDLRVGEEIVQEGLDVFEAVGPAEVEQHHADVDRLRWREVRTRGARRGRVCEHRTRTGGRPPPLHHCRSCRAASGASESSRELCRREPSAACGTQQQGRQQQPRHRGRHDPIQARTVMIAEDESRGKPCTSQIELEVYA